VAGHNLRTLPRMSTFKKIPTIVAVAGVALAGLGAGTVHAAGKTKTSCAGRAATIVSASPVIYGTEFNDVIVVIGIGTHTVQALGGDDIICGANSVDIVYGGHGNDRIDGRNGDDVLSGDLGDDIIFGNNGDDSIVGGEGRDYLFGLNGIDHITGDGGDDVIFGGNNDDHLAGSAGVDLIVGGNGDDELVVEEGIDIVFDGEPGGLAYKRA